MDYETIEQAHENEVLVTEETVKQEVEVDDANAASQAFLESDGAPTEMIGHP